MEYTFSTVQNDPIIRKQFLQKLDDIIFVEDHDYLIQNIIWLPEEVHKNMVYAYSGQYMNANVLEQCSKFVKQLFNKYTPIIYVHPYIDNEIDNLNIDSCHYLVDNYPNSSTDINLINIIEEYSPTIMERLLKNNKLSYDSFYGIMYDIIKSHRLDHFILLPLNQYFNKSLSSLISQIKNIDMLDYALNNYNIRYLPNHLFELLKNFEYSADIINRLMMHGFLDINTVYKKKYRFKKCNFVKLLYYVLCIKNKEVAFLLSNYVLLNNDLLENIKACVAAIKLLEHPNIILSDTLVRDKDLKNPMYTFIDQVTINLYNFYGNDISLCSKALIKKESIYIFEKIEKYSFAFI